MVISTYARNPTGKHACLEALVETSPGLPDTPAMAFHRGRIDLLEEHLARDHALLSRRFTEAEIFPPELGIEPGAGLTSASVEGATLLHLAVEYGEMEIAEWLIRKGMDVNIQAGIDAEGFGGHTALFHTVLSWGQREDKASFLLDHGAAPNVRATIRKQLRHIGDPEKEKMVEYRDVTAISYARKFVEPAWVNEPAVELIAEKGGVE